jgi:hypothetical protein
MDKRYPNLEPYIERLSIPVDRLSTEERSALIDQLYQRCFDGDRELDLFSCLLGPSVLHWQAWLWLGDFLKNQQDVILFFPEHRQAPSFRFHNSTDVIRTLRFGMNLRPDEFYLTNAATDFLLFYDHEDALYTYGTVADWLSNLKAQIFTMARIERQELYVVDVQIADFGREIRLSVRGTQEPVPAFEVVLKGAGGIEWDTSLRKEKEAKVQYFVFGGESLNPDVHNDRKYAAVRTSHFGITLTCKEISVEKVDAAS